MIKDKNYELLKLTYQNIFEKELIEEIAETSSIKDFKKDEVIIEIGSYIKQMPLLLEGAIKIIREDMIQGELLLYFIERGDTCAMTLTCCLGKTKSEIRAVSENSVKLIMVAVEKMEEWMIKYKSWRNFVLASYNSRMNELLLAIDTLAFMKMDERLLKYLKDKAKINQSNLIKNTHQEIAYELNTSRVVISRLLKALENKSIIKLKRNVIQLLQ